jgi:hypothetical protein
MKSPRTAKSEKLLNRASTAFLAQGDVVAPIHEHLWNEHEQNKKRDKDDENRPVLQISGELTKNERDAQRRLRAIRVQTDTYLPLSPIRSFIFPNGMLRSALFSAHRGTREGVVNQVIASSGDYALTFTGVLLTSADRANYGACMNAYRDLPLAKQDPFVGPLKPATPNDEDSGPAYDEEHFRPAAEHAPWIETTFSEFAASREVAYSQGAHEGIKKSLIRLNAAHLRMKHDGQNLPLKTPLIEVEFEESDSPRGSDRIRFRIAESIAQMFGPGRWSAVTIAALEYKGLAGWLIANLSTHNGAPVPMKLEHLQARSGLAEMRKNQFASSLKSALEALQADFELGNKRVLDYKFTKMNGTPCVRIRLASYQKSGT